MFEEEVKDVDIIITTALIPGMTAPVSLKEGVIKNMKAGSVIVDLGSERGGNSCLTNGHIGEKYISPEGIINLGYTDWASRMAP